ncbi:MAG: hypothetical protein Q7S07_02095 [Candidatus Omnitrophota bacterium]|nr:hypothetical protein [Candidatus Omnitrophota bacterium]
MSKAPAIALSIGIISLTLFTQAASAADMGQDPSAKEKWNTEARKIELAIDADRNMIIEESRAIKAARQKLKEAEKAGDASGAEGLRQNIKDREAVIEGLKKSIGNKKDSKNEIVYGKQIIPDRKREVPK